MVRGIAGRRVSQAPATQVVMHRHLGGDHLYHGDERRGGGIGTWGSHRPAALRRVPATSG
jgi:hypothetical protein